ncbi:hypothetical protein BSKO_06467 [Bryopsis sp. KO-2023]|nr:hypothetical protein BSKO_06467 [Bryopsis sp. KO-2023]
MSEGEGEEVVVPRGNPVTTILISVVGFVIFLLGLNVFLWWWAQRGVAPKPKKRYSAKKLKREKMKMGISSPGE